MVSSSTLFLCLSMALLSLPSPSFGDPQQNVTNKDIDIICSKTPDYDFCWRTIKSNPLATRGTLVSLAKTTIEAAIAEVNDTYKQLGPIITITSDQSIKQGYQLCLGHYIGAAASLKDALLLLNKSDFRTVRVLAASAGQEGILCEKELGIEPNKPSPIRVRNDNLSRYGSIIWAITNRLISASD
ncbi:hypothetical protein Tsubulata_031016 [Turnera subulata]|uniref:Pectinesterase inhibitor domain-containing protein n=1 Tax=Turnera subulata TaxID=218843 RepID=A0A9Q0FJ91_9ROSI|nr:hypothetical protein Tsubulata_031016 [Turnera subulata]